MLIWVHFRHGYFAHEKYKNVISGKNDKMSKSGKQYLCCFKDVLRISKITSIIAFCH